MNPLLKRLHPYPFERLRELTQGINPPAGLKPISLGIGEPRHPTPPLIEQALVGALSGLSNYPATAGEPALREAVAGWLHRRYGVNVNAMTQVLPVNGSREALFALAQTVVDASRPGATVVCPNPFYQIYEGAALLAGAQTAFANSDPARNFAVRWDDIDEATWARTQLLFVCSPGNPSIIKPFLLYRTYHGSAMSTVVQRASIAAWNDEEHVAANRALYREKFARVTHLLGEVMDVQLPDAGFYLWAGVPGGDDVTYALSLLAQYNVAVLPGSLLARSAHGANPGAGRIRLALVAGTDECVEAAERIVHHTRSLTS